jgi:hypothetical protein
MRFLDVGTAVSDEALRSEFEFWKSSFLRAAGLAVCTGVAAGVFILLWPAGSGNQELRTFARQLWTAFVECGFWFGFLVGLLWAASRRLGCALAGAVPWAPADEDRMRGLARTFGQTGCATAFGSLLLWLAAYFIHQLNPLDPAVSALLIQLLYAGWASAGVFIVLAVALGIILRIRS